MHISVDHLQPKRLPAFFQEELFVVHLFHCGERGLRSITVPLRKSKQTDDDDLEFELGSGG